MVILGFKLSEALEVFHQRLKLFLASFRYTFVVLKSSPEMIANFSIIATLWTGKIKLTVQISSKFLAAIGRR